MRRPSSLRRGARAAIGIGTLACLAAAAPASAATTCTVTGTALKVTVTGAAVNASAPRISRQRNGDQVLVDGNACGSPAATVTTIDKITIVDATTAGTLSPTIDLFAGSLAPGTLNESDGQSEIEVEVDGGAGSNTVNVLTGGRSPTVLIGNGDPATSLPGIDLNAAAEAGGRDSEIALSSIETVHVEGASGADTIDARGAAPYTAPLSAVLDAEGAEGPDRLFGGSGPDRFQTDVNIFGGSGIADDTVDGGAGFDSVSYAPFPDPLRLDLAVAGGQATGAAGRDSFVSIESVTGTRAGDRLAGTPGGDTIAAGPGDDVVLGRGATLPGTGNDALDGGDGLDEVSYEEGTAAGVAVTLALQVTQFTGAAGNNRVTGFEALTGTPFDDRLTGDSADNRLRGLAGADQLAGGGGGDELDGGAGDDTLDGGLGPDRFIGGPGTDTVDYSAQVAPLANGVTVDIGDGLANDGLPVGDAPGDDVGADVERVIGTSLGDDLTGAAGPEELVGGAGPDRLEGAAGADRLLGGPGDDLILSRDNTRDAAIECGDGTDRVVADAADVVAPDCETVERGGAAAPPAQPQPDPPSRGEGTGPGGGDNGRTPPEVAIVTRRASPDRRGAVKLRVRCVYRAKRCRGTLTLVAARTTAVRLPATRRGGKRRTVKVKAGTRIGRVTLGQIPWGTSRPVTVRLSAAARTLIARLGRRGLAVTARLAATDSAAGARAATARVSARVTLAAAPVRRLPRRR